MADEREKDLEQLLSAIGDSARTLSTRFVTFFTVTVYVAVTIASTTDEMLVKGSLVTLPLLNTQIPISGWFGFYTVAPWLVVVLHLDRMLQFSTLGAKLGELRAQVSQLTDEKRASLRQRIPNLYYVQFFTGEGTCVQRVLSGLIISGGMVLLPLVLLCWIQVRFLALHDPIVTLSHRLAVLIDAALILGLLWQPLSARNEGMPGHDPVRTRRHRFLPARTMALVICAVVVAICFAASIPGEQRGKSVWFNMRNLNLRERILTSTPMPAEAINALADGDVRQREEQLQKVSRQNFLQGRDLRYANFYNAVLPRLDLRSERSGEPNVDRRETHLEGAIFDWAQMQQVLLDDANLRGASLRGAQLQGGILASTELDGADLSQARLQDAKLPHVLLNGATLKDAQLQGADLTEAVLESADLSGANLQGALLRGAHLKRANLSDADLEGADLSGAQLGGATLRRANLRGALFGDQAFDLAVDVEGANFELTALDPARLARCPDPKACEESGNASDAEQLVTYLLKLACDDAYVARGLGTRALSSNDPEKSRLRAALLQHHGSGTECAGIALLPSSLLHALMMAEEGEAERSGQARVSIDSLRPAGLCAVAPAGHGRGRDDLAKGTTRRFEAAPAAQSSPRSRGDDAPAPRIARTEEPDAVREGQPPP
jgi:uncharacterized protein YjbI with pentapeptide repeats